MKQRVLASLLLSSLGAAGAIAFTRLATTTIGEVIVSPVWQARSYESGVAAVLLVLAAAFSAWYAASGILALLVLAGRARASAVTGYLAPLTSRLVRGASVASLGVALGAGLPLSAAMAAPATGDSPAPAASVAHSEVLPPLDPAPAPAPAPSAATTYEVKPGDCLWRIIEAELDSPSDAETARLVAEIAALNPAITDPNLIYPGQELSLGKDQP